MHHFAVIARDMDEGHVLDGLDRMGFDPLGRPMAARDHRRRAFEARQRATRASEPSIQADLHLIASHWLALAEQEEILERRYGALVSAEVASLRSEPVVQQQQQEQPKKDSDRKQ